MALRGGWGNQSGTGDKPGHVLTRRRADGGWCLFRFLFLAFMYLPACAGPAWRRRAQWHSLTACVWAGDWQALDMCVRKLQRQVVSASGSTAAALMSGASSGDLHGVVNAVRGSGGGYGPSARSSSGGRSSELVPWTRARDEHGYAGEAMHGCVQPVFAFIIHYFSHGVMLLAAPLQRSVHTRRRGR